MKNLELENLELATIEAIKVMRSWEENDWRLSELNEKIYNCFVGVNLYYNDPKFKNLRKLIFAVSYYSEFDNKTLASKLLHSAKFIQ